MSVPSHPPPSYGAAQADYQYESLPQHDLHGAPRADGDVDPDDFKIGVTVEQSGPEIRAVFVRRVRSDYGGFLMRRYTRFSSSRFSAP